MAEERKDPTGEKLSTKRRRDSKVMMAVGIAMIAYCLWTGRMDDAFLGNPLFMAVAVLAAGAGKYSLERLQMDKSI